MHQQTLLLPLFLLLLCSPGTDKPPVQLMEDVVVGKVSSN